MAKETVDDLMNKSSNPWDDKFKRAKAGLPPDAPKMKPLEHERHQQTRSVSDVDACIVPEWARTNQSRGVSSDAQKSKPKRHGSVPSKYASRADQIRAEWKPSPRYPTYDDYLAEKRRREQSVSLTPDQIAMNGPQTPMWMPDRNSGRGSRGGKRHNRGHRPDSDRW